MPRYTAEWVLAIELFLKPFICASVPVKSTVIAPPFTVTAVGDVEKLKVALDQERGVQIYKQYVERLGLVWKVAQLRSTTLPPYMGTVQTGG